MCVRIYVYIYVYIGADLYIHIIYICIHSSRYTMSACTLIALSLSLSVYIYIYIYMFCMRTSLSLSLSRSLSLSLPGQLPKPHGEAMDAQVTSLRAQLQKSVPWPAFTTRFASGKLHGSGSWDLRIRVSWKDWDLLFGAGRIDLRPRHPTSHEAF